MLVMTTPLLRGGALGDEVAGGVSRHTGRHTPPPLSRGEPHGPGFNICLFHYFRPLTASWTSQIPRRPGAISKIELKAPQSIFSRGGCKYSSGLENLLKTVIKRHRA